MGLAKYRAKRRERMNRSSVEQEVMAVTKVKEDVPLGAGLDETPEIAAFYTPLYTPFDCATTFQQVKIALRDRCEVQAPQDQQDGRCRAIGK
jgi:hypothetical protein